MVSAGARKLMRALDAAYTSDRCRPPGSVALVPLLFERNAACLRAEGWAMTRHVSSENQGLLLIDLLRDAHGTAAPLIRARVAAYGGANIDPGRFAGLARSLLRSGTQAHLAVLWEQVIAGSSPQRLHTLMEAARNACGTQPATLSRLALAFAQARMALAHPSGAPAPTAVVAEAVDAAAAAERPGPAASAAHTRPAAAAPARRTALPGTAPSARPAAASSPNSAAAILGRIEEHRREWTRKLDREMISGAPALDIGAELTRAHLGPQQLWECLRGLGEVAPLGSPRHTRIALDVLIWALDEARAGRMMPLGQHTDLWGRLEPRVVFARVWDEHHARAEHDGTGLRLGGRSYDRNPQAAAVALCDLMRAVAEDELPDADDPAALAGAFGAMAQGWAGRHGTGTDPDKAAEAFRAFLDALLAPSDKAGLGLEVATLTAVLRGLTEGDPDPETSFDRHLEPQLQAALAALGALSDSDDTSRRAALASASRDFRAGLARPAGENGPGPATKSRATGDSKAGSK